MQWLAALCVRRPVFAWVLVLSLTVVGLFAFGQLGVDRFPNVDVPTISVTTRLPGAAPEQIETEVTDKIEESVNTISAIDTLSSTSSEGISQVVVSFKLEKDADIAAQEVRDRVNRVMPQLPRTVLQPTVEKLDFTAAPVITVAVTADKPVRDITEFADRVLRRRLESSDGVGQVVVIGGRKRQVNLWLDPALLRAQRLSVNDVARALQSQNADVPGGRMDQGGQTVTLRTRGRIETIDGFGDVVLREVDGHPIRLRDVARVEDGMAEPRTQASVNGDADGAAADPQAVRHQHGGGRGERETPPRRARTDPAARLSAAHRPRRSAVHRGLDRQRAGTPDRRLDPRRHRRLRVPRQLPLHDDRGHRDSDLDRRDLRADLVHGLHAQHADHAGADALGRHRHRRRDRGAREHLSVHRREGHAAAAGGRRSDARRSASR